MCSIPLLLSACIDNSLTHQYISAHDEKGRLKLLYSSLELSNVPNDVGGNGRLRRSGIRLLMFKMKGR